MTFYATRRWLPPICLVALIAAVWAMPYRPDCDSLAWGDDPAIARIDSQCILLSHYAYRLQIVETTIENAEFGLLIDEQASTDYQRRWNDRVNFYGPETIALADAIRDSALYQGAVADGQVPSQEEVSARLDRDRLRWESFHDVVQLARLAQNQNLAEFGKLAVETRNPDIRRTLEDLTPSELMEAMKWNDWRQLEQTLREGEAYIESLDTSATGRKYSPRNCAAKWQRSSWRRRSWRPAPTVLTVLMQMCPAWRGWRTRRVRSKD